MTHDAWLARHPYLQPIAEVRALVDTAAGRVAAPVPREPGWQDYLADFQAGIPLLQSERVAIDVSDPLHVVRSMLEALLSMPLPQRVAGQCQALPGRSAGTH